jgi:ATP-binding cassette subfamily C protein CydD
LSAAASLIADPLAAVGFAAGLALAIGALPRGLAAAAPGALIAIASAAARGLLNRVGAGLAARRSSAARRRAREEMAQALLTPAAQGSQPLGEALALVTDAVETLDGWFTRFEPARLAAGVAPLLVLAVMGLASWPAALIVAATFIPLIAALILAGGAAADAARRQMTALTQLSAVFVDSVRSLPAILAFGAQAPAARRIAESSSAVAERTLGVLKIAFVSSAALEFFAALSVALVAVYCGFSLLGILPFPAPERLDLTHAVFVLVLAPEAYLPLRRLAGAYHERETAQAAATVLAETLAHSEATPAAARLATPSPPEVRFEAVRLAWPGAASPALEVFDLRLEPGECVALLGPSGSGKTSVLRLLLGLVEPTSGRVLVDGRPGCLDSAAFVGQAPLIIPGDIAANIRLARREASDAEVALAARRAGLAPKALSRQLDERGGGLSGGERRRVALARAFLSKARVVLLDEPTADLDLASEAALLDTIAELAQGRTTLIATHSAAVASLADRCVSLGA